MPVVSEKLPTVIPVTLKSSGFDNKLYGHSIWNSSLITANSSSFPWHKSASSPLICGSQNYSSYLIPSLVFARWSPSKFGWLPRTSPDRDRLNHGPFHCPVEAEAGSAGSQASRQPSSGLRALRCSCVPRDKGRDKRTAGKLVNFLWLFFF